MSRLLGYVTEEEKNCMDDIMEKKKALENLYRMIDPEKEQKLAGEIEEEYQLMRKDYMRWWQDVCAKYGWTGTDINLDLSSCAVTEG